MPTPQSKVLIAHVPYRNRGGEDHHVDTLVPIYESLGWKPELTPANRDPLSYGMYDIARSLSGRLEVDWSAYGFVHLHNLFPALGPAFLRAALDSGKPVIWTVHNHRFYCTNGLALYRGQRCEICKNAPSAVRPIVKNCNDDLPKSAYYAAALYAIRRDGLLNRVHRFVAPSPYIAEEIRALGVSPDRIEILPNPVFERGISDMPPLDSGGVRRQKLVYAGRLSQEKGVRILAALARQLPEFDLEIYGDGPELSAIRAESSGLSNLRLHGAVPRSKVIAAIQSCDAGLLPSICNEICPTFAIETLAEGKPVYLQASPSTRWLVENYGAVGVPSGEPEAFARVLRAEPPSPLADTVRAEVRRVFATDTYAASLQKLIASFPAAEKAGQI